MDKKFIIFIVLAALAIGGVVFYGMNRPSTKNDSAGFIVSNNIKRDKETEKIEKVFTLGEVAAQNSQGSCFTVINGSVYDLTSWIANHPGGEKAIISLCGKDGSELFNNQHGGQEKPEKILANFKIGTLKN